MTDKATQKPDSALATLKALSKKKKPEAGAGAATGMVAQVTDPAIAGAVRKGKTSVVHLGADPGVTEDASICAQLKEALDAAQAEFAVRQTIIRDYGKRKRDLYNETFKSDVTTVCVPYQVEVPHDPNSKTPGKETRYVQVICSNKYSVAQDTIEGHRESIGTFFSQLFVEDRQKVLRANAEELVRGILTEQGIVGEDLEEAMNTLFEEKVSIKTASDYEEKEKAAPPAVRAILSQAVTRAQPGLKFP